MEIITPILHGLAYIFIWLFNFLIYELIGVAIWAIIAWLIFRSKKIKEPIATNIVMSLLMLVICLSVGAGILYCFGYLRIIPLPVF